MKVKCKIIKVDNHLVENIKLLDILKLDYQIRYLNYFSKGDLVYKRLYLLEGEALHSLMVGNNVLEPPNDFIQKYLTNLGLINQPVTIEDYKKVYREMKNAFN